MGATRITTLPPELKIGGVEMKKCSYNGGQPCNGCGERSKEWSTCQWGDPRWEMNQEQLKWETNKNIFEKAERLSDEEIIEDYIDRMCLYCTDPGHSAEYPFCDDHMNLGMGYECPNCGKETQPECAYCPFCGYDLGGHHASLP